VRELVGGNMTRARIGAKLTQEQLGQQLGVSRTQVSMWERGRRLPSYRFMYAIADALGHGHDLCWFYSEHVEPPASAP
jgi:transcriptional regulator with XRE-family HTH domain